MSAETVSDLETPAVVVDRERLIANIATVAGIAKQRGVRLRPHVKTHKCVEIARLQLERGAVGLTASKVDEALVFIESGVRSMTVAYPLVDERKAHRLLRAAKLHGTDLRVVVDSRRGVELLSRVAVKLAVTIGVLIEIDVGLHRCGVNESDPQLLELVQLIRTGGQLRFVGLLSHAGHAYAANNSGEVAEIAAEECKIMQRVQRRLVSARIDVEEVSVGSTPTVLASDTYEGITEIRPGNYVFMDRTPVRLGLASIEQVALTVVASVVSRNDKHLIIDAGSKVLTSDLGAHGTAGAGGYGLAFPLSGACTPGSSLIVLKLSEEHGFIERGAADIPVGAKVRIVPNHSCPVVTLADELVVVSRDGNVERWRVAARGKVR